MALTVSKEILDDAWAAHLSGNVALAYSILSNAGDRYASYAHRITDGVPDSFETQVKKLWEAAAPGSVSED